MLRLTVCVLFSTAAFAQQYAGAPSAIPMDFNDDIYNRDMRIPPANNFVYNFEQARRDQPPQIEMREENLGKYMGRPRTTTLRPVMPNLHEPRVPEIETVHLHHLTDKAVSMKPYVPQHWDPISSHLPATIPPAPTTPKWIDLSDDSFRHHSHHKSSRHPVTNYEPAPTQAPVPQWPQPAPSYIEEMVQQPEMSYSNPMAQYGPPSTEYAVPFKHFEREKPEARMSPRGSHKFSWSDVAVPEAAPVVPTTSAPMSAAVAPQNRGPPSSFPTLSPWLDGFGK